MQRSKSITYTDTPGAGIVLPQQADMQNRPKPQSLAFMQDRTLHQQHPDPQHIPLQSSSVPNNDQTIWMQ
ncbi:hypothetical protein AF72_12215 [Xylella taiwanensis]|uniref:Uncharacterized protein n=1 Tax=Xylella taiwanensis TaxID=1444770 RepID=Z9JHF5_9GAMM|nr:hypothetical protein AB672_03955 [Xylella taiwanensis]EWS77182.1 hypothetical protein AF72_12215 [Xylella taiwanensis]